MISVVVPAYNAGKTIIRCLNSIQNQTYSNLEIIVVNDGSIDDTAEKVSSLQENDNRINLFTIPNGGVSHARNYGIDNATGDYITFVDSDDFIDKEMYEVLMGIILQYKVEIAHCSYKNIDCVGNVLSVVGDNNKVVCQNHNEAMECLIGGTLFAGGIWNKLYSISLFYNTRLNEKIKFNEDVLLNYYLFDKVKSSVYTDRPLYNYVALDTSSTHTADSLKANREFLYVAKTIRNSCKEESYLITAEKRVARCLLNLYRALLYSKESAYKKEKSDVLKEIKEYKSKGFYKSKNEMITVFMYKYFPKAFRLLYKSYDKIRVKQLDPKQ
jgi:glycosyltransferase involved in cell wall biosynthesis